ncbi:MAG: hypothetical protein RIQ34_1418 [Bacteroidota bacterium]|jgi:3,4-dihydroxy 2-butanone 4-phosphate synthase/GTP cyclohydrolase II
MQLEFDTLETALDALREGRPILVVDDASRENEGDIIIAAEYATPENINFCVTHARGLVCLAIDWSTAQRLGLLRMRSNHQDAFHTAFLDSIDAVPKWGTSTGISAADRSITAQLVANPTSGPADFIRPGHLFPLLAKEGGVLMRRGHTEASVDLCKLSGLSGAAIICEVMSDDGTMMRNPALYDYARQHALPYISVEQLVAYRKKHSIIPDTDMFPIRTAPACVCFSTAQLPTRYGNFLVRSFRNTNTFDEHLMLSFSEKPDQTPLVRLHSECVTGDVLSSLRCDCGDQLKLSLQSIQERGHGHLIYIKGQEGRGIGLANKIAAYSLQEKGHNTFEANTQLGFAIDSRQYADAVDMLHESNVDHFELLTANPEKIAALQVAGFTFQAKPMCTKPNPINKQYMSDKETYFNQYSKVHP